MMSMIASGSSGLHAIFISILAGEDRLLIQSTQYRPIRIYRVFQKKVAPLKLFGIFSLLLSLFALNFADSLAIHIHVYLPIFVDLS